MFNGIGETGFGELLTRRMKMPGGSAAPAVAPEIFPTFALEVDRPEWGWLKGELAHSVSTSETAAVGELTKIQLFNPPGSGIIAVLKQYSAFAASSNIQLARLPAGYVSTLTNETQSGPMDSRVAMPAVTRASACRVFRDNEVGATAGARQLWIRSGTNGEDVSFPAVLLPGFTLEWSLQSTNVAITLCAWWTERPAMPGELG